MANFYRDLTRILIENGYTHFRAGKGDHEIWLNKETRRKLTVDAGITSRHTANEILKKAGLPKAF